MLTVNLISKVKQTNHFKDQISFLQLKKYKIKLENFQVTSYLLSKGHQEIDLQMEKVQDMIQAIQIILWLELAKIQFKTSHFIIQIKKFKEKNKNRKYQINFKNQKEFKSLMNKN